MIKDIIEMIKEDIIKSYGSISDPSGYFLERRYRSRPYAKLLNELANIGGIHETTEPNCDVSVVVYVEPAEEEPFNVKMSLVGKFACLSNKLDIIQTSTSIEKNSSLSKTRTLLEKFGVTVIYPEILKTEMEFGGEVRNIYEIMFSSDEAITRE